MNQVSFWPKRFLLKEDMQNKSMIFVKVLYQNKTETMEITSDITLSDLKTMILVCPFFLCPYDPLIPDS